MSTIHVKYGLEFRPDLYNTRDRGAWLEAAGQELEKKGVSIKIGEGNNAREIKNAGDLKSFYDRYESNPSAVASEIGLPAGRDIQRYISDLVQAVDDVVKDSSSISWGTSVDLRTSGEMSKMLGLDDASKRYASSRTDFGATPADGTKSVLGVLLSHHAAPANPLAGTPHINPTTFSGGSMKTDRKSEEFEAVKTLAGVDKDQLIELLRSERGGRPILNRMRKAKDAEAFTLGYSGMSIDDMRWDSRAHAVREANPYVSITVEPGRMELDDGEYEVSLGNDYFEDAYYDTPNFDLIDSGMSIRGRIRRDDPVPGAAGVRRVLIQSKMGSNVDEDGVKYAAKADIRKDRPSEEDIAGLDEDVRTGLSGWSWGSNSPDKPIEAIGLVYDKLGELGRLETVGDQEGIMRLEPKAHVRSTRSRFHFNLTRRNSMHDLYAQAGEPNIKKTLELLEKSGSVDPSEAQNLKDLGQGILDGSLIAERAADKLKAIDPSITDVNADTLKDLMPSRTSTRDKMTALKREVVADTVKELYNEFAEALDDNRSRIAESRGDALRPFDMPDEAMDFMRSKFPELATKQTVAPFIEKFDAELAGPNRDAFIEELGEFAANEGNDSLKTATNKDEALAGIRKHLVNEDLDIMHRQIEAAGSMGKALYFEDAKQAFANVSSSGSNFLIDTFDVSEFYSPEAWAELTPEQKAGAEDIAADKMFHAKLVNEVQIELGTEKPYTEAVKKAEDKISNARAGLFMDYAIANNMDVEADKPETFVALRDQIAGMSDPEQQELLTKLNDFAQEKGSPLGFNLDQIKGFEAARLTSGNQNQKTDGHAMLLKEVEVNSFIWDKLVDMQESIANLRGRRVIREAERAGLSGVAWENSDESKGKTAVSMIREGVN